MKKRYPVTETDEVKEALRSAGRRWPDLAGQPTALLNMLIAEGHRAVLRSSESRRDDVLATEGALDDVFTPGYLEELREDWPE